jgi:hypothetical protein
MITQIRAILIALATALCFHQNANAQTDWQSTADSILQYVNKAPVSSGILIDRAIPISNLVRFNNNTDTSSYEYAIQVYAELYGANYRPQRMTAPGMLYDMIAAQNIRNRIPIQVLDYTYHQVKPTAIQDGLLSYDNNSGLVYNTSGSPNPFIEKRLQLATLLTENIESTTATLVLMPHFISRNTGLNVQQVSISGAGINKVLTGPLDSVTVVFPATGIHTLNITTTFSNGSSFTTKNKVSIGQASAATARFEAPPACYSTPFVGNIPWQGYDEGRGYIGKFDLDIYYRDGENCGSGEKPLKSPIILIDGFDPTDKRTSKNRQLYTKFLKYFDDVNSNTPVELDFVKQIQILGYDVILADIPAYFYANTGNIIPLDSNANTPPPGYTFDMGKLIRGGGDYVERNALTLVSLLIDIQRKLDLAGSADSIVLIGPSMGGQITRYALKYMEDRNIPHRVRLWISQDSNHEGAVVPIGEQFIVASTASGGTAAAIIARDRQLLAPAARQFLVNHFTHHVTDFNKLTMNTEQAGGSPGYFDRYYRAIDSIGWPQQCRKISTISGAENGTPLDMPGATLPAAKFEVQLGNVNYFLSLLCGFYSSTNCRVATYTMFTAPGPGQRGLVAKVRIPRKKENEREFWVIGSNQTSSQSVEAVQSGFYWGYKEFVEKLDKAYIPVITTSFGPFTLDTLYGFYAPITKTLYTGKHAHQPTGSTLAFGKGSNPNVYGKQFKWDEDVTYFNLACDKYIPFDYYMGPETFSVLHDSIFYRQAQILIEEIQGIKHDNKKNRQVTLQCVNPAPVWCVGDTRTFRVLNPPAGASFNWTTLNPQLSIVSGQGTPEVSFVYAYPRNGSPISQVQHISVSGATECYNYTGSTRVTAGGLADVNLITGEFQYNPSNGLTYPLDFGIHPNVITDVSAVKVNFGSDAGNIMYGLTNLSYTLLNNPPIAFNWQYQNNDPRTAGLYVNAQPTNDINNTLWFRADYSNSCDGLPRSATFGLYFMAYRNNARTISSAYTINGNQLSIPILQGGEKAGNIPVQVRVYDISGKLLKTIKGYENNRRIIINIDGIANGIYLVSATKPTGVITQKVWINR